MQLSAAALYIHPIKTCAPLRVSRLEIAADGRVLGDREWAIVDAENGVTWQGSFPRLALLHPAFEGEHLVLRALDRAPVSVSRDGGQPCMVKIWNDVDKRADSFDAFDAGDQAAELLRYLCGAELRLVRLTPAAPLRPTNNQLHLLGRPSMRELDPGLAIERFRANIVLEGEELLPFMEENISSLRWAGGQMTVGERCVRCIMPNVDPLSAEVSPAVGETVAALSAQRYPGGPSYFGVYARAPGGVVLQEGEVLEAELNF
ncbi:MAG TPA: MOSC N-terminal beta barrel domain-containing protein [Burkholderiaceae bacterium]|jgi:hypothetical protein